MSDYESSDDYSAESERVSLNGVSMQNQKIIMDLPNIDPQHVLTDENLIKCDLKKLYDTVPDKHTKELFLNILQNYKTLSDLTWKLHFAQVELLMKNEKFKLNNVESLLQDAYNNIPLNPRLNSQFLNPPYVDVLKSRTEVQEQTAQLLEKLQAHFQNLEKNVTKSRRREK